MLQSHIKRLKRGGNATKTSVVKLRNTHRSALPVSKSKFSFSPPISTDTKYSMPPAGEAVVDESWRFLKAKASLKAWDTSSVGTK